MAGAEFSVSGMTGRYATALFALAKDAGAIDQVLGDLDQFVAMLNASTDLSRLVASPVFTREQSSRAVLSVLAKAGIDGLAAKFIGLVAQNRRLFAILAMIKDYRALVADHKGEVTAQVTTAEPLGATQKKALAAALKAALGQVPKIEQHVDPGLLGGLVVKVGSRMVDNSLKSKLNNLRKAMKEVG